jgi:geranylgeranyl diphosphate synthase type II
VLDEYGAVTRVALARYLAPRSPERYLYRLVGDYPQRGGRMLRPSLCHRDGGASSGHGRGRGELRRCVGALHNAFLVHDDVEDESEIRRGRPTLHELHGVPVAVNVGDALTLLGLRALMNNRSTLGPRVTLRVLEEAERMARESVEGQAIELGCVATIRSRCARRTTSRWCSRRPAGTSTIYPSRVGSLIGTGSECDLDRFIRFGFFLGAAFQIQDDLLNLVGNPQRYGKELDGDVREGKRDADADRPAAPGLRRATGAGCKPFLPAPRGTHQSTKWRGSAGRIRAYGCIERARKTAHAARGRRTTRVRAVVCRAAAES